MKIISDFYDYYDTICRQNYDDGLTLIRKASIDRKKITDKFRWFGNDIIIVGFATPPVYIGYITNYRENLFITTPRYECIWGKEKILNHVKPGSSKEYVRINSNEWAFLNFKQKLERAETYDWSDVFKEYGPIWSMTFSDWAAFIEKNPLLNRYQFAKALPPLKAYIALRKYVMNQAEPAKDIPQVSDEMMAEIKGFSAKTSFRKEKGQGPKRKRKGN
jgi:hypothetical protein